MSTIPLAATRDAGSALPDGFADLEPFLGRWALATEVERNAMRRSSTMVDIRAFYDATSGRLADISDYLGRRRRDQLEPEAQTLLLLALSLMEVAPAVELYFQPDVVDAAPAEQLLILQ